MKTPEGLIFYDVLLISIQTLCWLSARDIPLLTPIHQTNKHENAVEFVWDYWNLFIKHLK